MGYHGNKTVYRVGLVYIPKGDNETKEKLEKVYRGIREQLTAAENMSQKVILMGDFNCKVGKEIKGNKKEVSKGGRILLKMVTECRLKLVNSHEGCKGKWTRIEKDQYSILDYLIINECHQDRIKTVTIDEEKTNTPYRITKEGGKIKTVHTDHCALICEIKWMLEGQKRNKEEDEKVMNEKAYKRYRQMIETQEVAKIWEKEGTMKEVYNSWNKKILDIKETCKVRRRKSKDQNKTTRILHTIKRKLKKEAKKENNKEKKKKYRTREKKVKEWIWEEEQERHHRKLKKTIEELRKEGGGMKEETFWQFKKRIDKKGEEKPTAIMDEKGTVLEKKEDILKEYEEFYKKLFERKEAKTEEGRETEKEIHKKLEKIWENAKDQKALVIKEEDVKKVVKGLKKRKAGDTQGWQNEMITEGGEEMLKSLTLMFNRILQDEEIPEQWEQMKIKSIYKNKGTRKDLKNRRGLFITNNISKVFERVIKQEADKTIIMDQCQNGGRKGRSTKDNWMVMMASMEENRRLGKHTWMIFADAVKCFDKLWLEDCLVQLKEAGMREKEVRMIEIMNNKARITVDTPSGLTNEIEVKRIVKQGTVYGPQLCCVSTAQINQIGEMPTTCVTAEIATNALVFVDDIGGMGEIETINVIGESLRKMEERKKYEFSKEKSKYIMIRTGKGKAEEEPKVKLSGGEMESTEEYKYLGNYISSEGNIKRQLKEIRGKAEGIIKGISTMASEHNLGTMSTEARIMLYEKTAAPSLYYNLEVWNNINKQEWEELEKVQANILK